MSPAQQKAGLLGPLRPVTQAKKWLFLGDSITMGARHTHGWRDYTQLFAERLRHELKRHRDLILNAAVDGATSADCLANLQGVLATFRPDVALVMIGMNDAAADRRIPIAQFKTTLCAIVQKLRAGGVHVVLQTPNLIIPASAAPYRRKFNRIVSAIREVAAEVNVPLIDHARHWITFFQGANRSLVVSYMCDGIHPNGFGHILLARQLFLALGIYDPTAPSCRKPIPQDPSLPQLQRQANKS